MEFDRDDLITNENHYRAKMAENKPVVTEKRHKYHHSMVANQALKMINSVGIDPFVKRVMTLRILGPLTTGRERTYMSIALELGATETEVISAEKYGVHVMQMIMEKVEDKEFVEKFNRDQLVANAVKNMSVKQANPTQ